MFAMFSWIVDVVTSLLHFVINAIETLLTLLAMLPRAIAYAFAAFSYFPPFLAAFLYLIIALAVFFLLIGRKGS